MKYKSKKGVIMGLVQKAALKTTANADHIQLELVDLMRDFQWTWMQDGNKCILVAQSVYGLWIWKDATHTTKSHCDPGDYVIVREDGSVLFKDSTQLAAMNLIPWVAPDLSKATFF
jgi:hypothetical protein